MTVQFICVLLFRLHKCHFHTVFVTVGRGHGYALVRRLAVRISDVQVHSRGPEVENKGYGPSYALVRRLCARLCTCTPPNP